MKKMAIFYENMMKKMAILDRQSTKFINQVI